MEAKQTSGLMTCTQTTPTGNCIAALAINGVGTWHNSEHSHEASVKMKDFSTDRGCAADTCSTPLKAGPGKHVSGIRRQPGSLTEGLRRICRMGQPSTSLLWKMSGALTLAAPYASS